MSTRAQIVLKDGREKLWFYRHSDGYPETTYKSLLTFSSWLKKGLIRNNISQCSGWLVILGHIEYAVPNAPAQEPIYGWKVGAYEPDTSGMHGDTEYLYTIDLKTKEITWQECGDDFTKVYNQSDYDERMTPKEKEDSSVF